MSFSSGVCFENVKLTPPKHTDLYHRKPWMLCLGIWATYIVALVCSSSVCPLLETAEAGREDGNERLGWKQSWCVQRGLSQNLAAVWTDSPVGIVSWSWKWIMMLQLRTSYVWWIHGVLIWKVMIWIYAQYLNDLCIISQDCLFACE